MKTIWFFEKEIKQNPKTPRVGIKVKKEVFSQRTPYQKIEIFDTKPYGRMLVLDSLIQLTEKDEFIYHEMLVHPAMFLHPNPKRALIIGGGDGGALREVLKHEVEEVYLDDIDPKVIEAAKRYLPFVSKGAFDSKKVKIFNEDGLKFIKKFKNFFDVIIADATDPTPRDFAIGLFKKPFFKDAFFALKSDGLVSNQSGCFSDYFFKESLKNIKKIFPFAEIHKAFIPCFPEMEHTFTVGAKFDIGKVSQKEIQRRFEKLKEKEFKYYSPEIHFASKVLPKYIKENYIRGII